MDSVTERAQVREQRTETPPPGLGGRLLRVVRGPRAVARWAVASLVVNIVIVVTGALVRLTSSGLGCPTWPRCTTDSYTTHPALGLHGAIEFGNRLLTFVLVIVALLTWVAALLHRDERRPERGGRRRDLRWIAAGLAFGIPAQAVIGGISVLTQLNPFVVGLHLLVSMVLIALSVWLVRRTRGLEPVPVGRGASLAVRATFVAMLVAVWLGTIVTGSGPHAGDENAARTGFDGSFVTHLHAAAVYVVVATTLVAVWLLRSRAALLVLGVVVAQAVIGIVQYELGVPVVLVMLHLLGASLATAASANLFLSVRRSSPTPSRLGTSPAR
ncbi:heme A synthase [uncultured Friedmanniella sp.]|uniref:COX15/CtaA family protein n=1 Tax=uncultured Friedmanniella sp. TaxID=335381 RepID=UPI0035CAED44